MTTNATQNFSSQDITYFSPPVKKIALATLAVTIIAAGVLGTAYLASDFTPLASSNYLFSPLANLSTTIKLTATVSSCLLVGLGSAALIIALKKSKVTPASIFKKGFNPHPLLNKIQEDTEHPQIGEKIAAVKRFLAQGYNSKTEYYTFYHTLATITEIVMNEDQFINEWKTFLTQLEGTIVNRNDLKHHIQIDCSFELARLEKQPIEIAVEEVIDPDEAKKAEIRALAVEAFDNFDTVNVTHRIFDSFRTEKCFVVYHTTLDQRKIVVGCIFLQEIDKGQTLFVHTLARKAAAVKLGMTKKYKEHLTKLVSEKKYKQIECQVDDDNETAFRIYCDLGFRTTGEVVFIEGKNVKYMQYNPKGHHVQLTYFL